MSTEYQLHTCLAKGGMAEAWLASRTAGGDGAPPVVVKLLRRELARDGRLLKLFKQESEIGRTLHHPNIVSLVDAGKLQGRHYIATEYVAGATVRELQCLTTRCGYHLPPWVVLRVLTGTCRGLHYAYTFRDHDGHRLGLVHRDLTPENIIVSYTGDVKILDFGIATTSAYAHRRHSTARRGKFAYMAPEALRDEPCDIRSDIYSVGVMLYELLSGALPYDGHEPEEYICQALTTDPPPLHHRAPWLSPRLSGITARAMARDAANRYPDTLSLVHDMGVYLERNDKTRIARELGMFAAILKPHDEHVPGDIGDLLRQWPTAAIKLPPEKARRWTWVNQLMGLPPAAAVNGNPNALVSRTGTPIAHAASPDSPPGTIAGHQETLEVSVRTDTKDTAGEHPSGTTNATRSTGDTRPHDMTPDRQDDDDTDIAIELEPMPDEESLAELAEDAGIDTAEESDDGRPASPPPPAPPAWPGNGSHLKAASELDRLWKMAAEAKQAWSRTASERDISSYFAPRPPSERPVETAASAPFASTTHTADDGEQTGDTGGVVQPVSPVAEAMSRFEEGLQAVRTKDYTDALRCFEQAVALDPANRLFKTNLRRVQTLVGRQEPHGGSHA